MLENGSSRRWGYGGSLRIQYLPKCRSSFQLETNEPAAGRLFDLDLTPLNGAYSNEEDTSRIGKSLSGRHSR
jgi:hypothetical protein